MTFVTGKKAALVAILVFLAIAAVAVRSRVEKIFRHPSITPPPLSGESISSGAAALLPSASSTSRIGVTQQGVPSVPNALAYHGRDPEEVHPSEKEAELFSAEQKAQIYAKIKADGESVKKMPHDFNVWADLAIEKKLIGDFAGARDIWEYMNVSWPKNFVSFGNLGELYWEYMPDYPRAEKNFRTAIANEPTNDQNYLSLAHLYEYSFQAKRDQAAAVLREGVDHSSSVVLIKALASFYEQNKEYADALEWWKKALEYEPNNQDIKTKIDELQKMNL